MRERSTDRYRKGCPLPFLPQFPVFSPVIIYVSTLMNLTSLLIRGRKIGLHPSRLASIFFSLTLSLCRAIGAPACVFFSCLTSARG